MGYRGGLRTIVLQQCVTVLVGVPSTSIQEGCDTGDEVRSEVHVVEFNVKLAGL